MTTVLPQLFVEVLSGERDGEGLFRLTAPFIWNDVTVPQGYVTDFASIPRPFRWLFCTSGKSAKAALLHDWLMSRQDIPKATRVFGEVLKESNVSAFSRFCMVGFVFIFTFPDRFFGNKPIK